MSAVAVLVLAASVGSVPGGPGAAPATAQAPGPDEGDRVVYAPPVVAPVTDPFRPPPQPWLPGNRGIEYATAPGTPVRAAGRGRVSFAGPVAGALHVTVTHPDGVRTSYSFLATVVVRAGAEVLRGQVVGTTGARLHVGARRGDTYIDPASLWGSAGPAWVRLAPLDGGGGGRPEGTDPAGAGWWRRWGGDLDSSVGPGTRSGPCTQPHSPVHQRSPHCGVRTG